MKIVNSVSFQELSVLSSVPEVTGPDKTSLPITYSSCRCVLQCYNKALGIVAFFMDILLLDFL